MWLRRTLIYPSKLEFNLNVSIYWMRTKRYVSKLYWISEVCFKLSKLFNYQSFFSKIFHYTVTNLGDLQLLKSSSILELTTENLFYAGFDSQIPWGSSGLKMNSDSCLQKLIEKLWKILFIPELTIYKSSVYTVDFILLQTSSSEFSGLDLCG